MFSRPRTAFNYDDEFTNVAIVDTNNEFRFDQKEADESNYKTCGYCGRTFFDQSLAKHEGYCKKQKMYQNDAKGDCENYQGSQIQPTSSMSSMLELGRERRKRWKFRHEEFIKTLRGIRGELSMISMNKMEVNSSTEMIEQSDLKPCSFCGRSFSETSFEKHVAHCEEVSRRMPATGADKERRDEALSKFRSRMKYGVGHRLVRSDTYSILQLSASTTSTSSNSCTPYPSPTSSVSLHEACTAYSEADELYNFSQSWTCPLSDSGNSSPWNVVPQSSNCNELKYSTGLPITRQSMEVQDQSTTARDHSYLSRELLPRKSLFTEDFEPELLSSFDCSSPSEASSLSTISLVTSSICTRPMGSANSGSGLPEPVSQKHYPWSPTVSSFANRPSFVGGLPDDSERNKQHVDYDTGIGRVSKSPNYPEFVRKPEFTQFGSEKPDHLGTNGKSRQEIFGEQNSISSKYSQCSDATGFSAVCARPFSGQDPDALPKSRLKKANTKHVCRNQGDRYHQHRPSSHYHSQTSLQSGDDDSANFTDHDDATEGSPVYFVCHVADRSQKLNDSQLIRIPFAEDKNGATNISSCLESQMCLGSERQGSVGKLAQMNVAETGMCCTHELVSKDSIEPGRFVPHVGKSGDFRTNASESEVGVTDTGEFYVMPTLDASTIERGIHTTDMSLVVEDGPHPVPLRDATETDKRKPDLTLAHSLEKSAILSSAIKPKQSMPTRYPIGASTSMLLAKAMFDHKAFRTLENDAARISEPSNLNASRKQVSITVPLAESEPPQYCHECGKRYVTTSAKFCSYCGTVRAKQVTASNIEEQRKERDRISSSNGRLSNPKPFSVHLGPSLQNICMFQ